MTFDEWAKSRGLEDKSGYEHYWAEEAWNAAMDEAVRLTALARPESFNFSMDFLGGTEATEMLEYVQSLEPYAYRYAWLRKYANPGCGTQDHKVSLMICDFEGKTWDDVDAFIERQIRDGPEKNRDDQL